jgi:hypothetical protein
MKKAYRNFVIALKEQLFRLLGPKSDLMLPKGKQPIQSDNRKALKPRKDTNS